MPVTWRKSNDDYSIILWKSIEEIDELFRNACLTDAEIQEWKLFKSKTRQREWLTVRNALKMILPGDEVPVIYYDPNGKPHLKKNGLISISHSNEFVAVMNASESSIGIDIEFLHPRIQKLSQKFLNDFEKRNTADDTIEKLHVIWGAKEVLYKIHSIGGLDFKKDFQVHPFDCRDSGELKASIVKQGFEEDFLISYEKTDQYMLTWTQRQKK